MAVDITFRHADTFSAKVVTTAAAGATAITLNSLTTGYDRVKVGDRFNTNSFTVETVAVNGTITAAPFSPALTSQITANTSLMITRYTPERWSRARAGEGSMGIPMGVTVPA